MIDGDLKRFLRQIVRGSAWSAAKHEALEQIDMEIGNKLRSASPLSDEASLEQMLRAQGELRGAMRFVELIEEMGELTDGE